MRLSFVLLVLALVQGRSVPLATDVDRALAQLEVSLDGKTLTVREVAPDDLTLCVAPKAGQFGPRR